MTAAGLVPGGEYAAHIHYGACTDYLGHFQYEHPGPATRENEIWLDLDADAEGRAVDQVQVSSFDLDQSLSLVIHQHSNPDTGPGDVDHLLPEYERLLTQIAETRAALKQELHRALTFTPGPEA